LGAHALIGLAGTHVLISLMGAYAQMRGDNLVKPARVAVGFIKGLGVTKENRLNPW